MATITVQLDDEASAFLAQQVSEGRYPDQETAVQGGIRALQQYERDDLERLEYLRCEIQKGIDSGPGLEADEVFRRLRAKHGLPPRPTA